MKYIITVKINNGKFNDTDWTLLAHVAAATRNNMTFKIQSKYFHISIETKSNMFESLRLVPTNDNNH